MGLFERFVDQLVSRAMEDRNFVPLLFIVSVLTYEFIILANDYKESVTAETAGNNPEKRVLENRVTNVNKIDKAHEDDVHEGPRVPFRGAVHPEVIMMSRIENFYHEMNARRSVRSISSKPVDRKIIERIVQTAGTSPSGAHNQPWTFVVVSDPEVKSQIREIVEREEKDNYDVRMSRQWVEELRPLATNWRKGYLTEAPFIILLFKQLSRVEFETGEKRVNRYPEQSVGIAAGFLLAAIQMAGLVTVTTTPMNCGGQLRNLLKRPASEKLALLFPVGYAKTGATVPDLGRKSLEEISVFI